MNTEEGQIKIWEQSESESKKAYELFSDYLFMGPKRSLSKLSAKHGYKNTRSLEQYSSKFQWDIRVKAYLKHCIQSAYFDSLKVANEMIDNTLVSFNVVSQALLKKLAVSSKELESMKYPELLKLLIDISKVVGPLVELKTFSKEQTSQYDKQDDLIKQLLQNLDEETVNEIIELISAKDTD